MYVVGWEDSNVTDETVTITHSSLPGAGFAPEYQGRSKTLQVNVTDNDGGLALTPQAVTVQEGGSYTVVLNRQPTGPVTVTARSTTAAVALDTDGTPQTRTLTFSTTSWNTAQAVTVRPTDAADGVDETVTIQHTAAAGSSDPAFSFVALPINAVTVTSADAAVTVDTDDTPQTVDLMILGDAVPRLIVRVWVWVMAPPSPSVLLDAT